MHPDLDLPTFSIAHARSVAVTGAVFAGLAVAIGAFGAHGLEDRVAPERLATFEVGARYHMYHALGLFLVAWSRGVLKDALTLWVARLFVAGIVVFSGSLYALVLTDTGWLGAITPIGGVCFIAGWGTLAAAWYRNGRAL